MCCAVVRILDYSVHFSSHILYILHFTPNLSKILIPVSNIQGYSTNRKLETLGYQDNKGFLNWKNIFYEDDIVFK